MVDMIVQNSAGRAADADGYQLTGSALPSS
jgi:hypothetical protein